MKITQILMAEHVVFHNLFDYIEQTAPHLKSPAEVKLLSATLEVLMRAHAQTEDDLLVEPLEHCLAQIRQNETFTKSTTRLMPGWWRCRKRGAQNRRVSCCCRRYCVRATILTRKNASFSRSRNG